MSRARELFERIKAEGVAAIDRLIDERASEELFLDFKRSGDNGIGRNLHRDDRKNLGRAISGFGNSAGGVVVWGIDCRPDGSGNDQPSRSPLADAHGFRSRIEGATSGVTVPPHDGVESFVVPASNSDTSGYVATLVPKCTYAPLRVVVSGSESDRYLIRAGSSFQSIPHDALAGLFGRLPLSQMWLQMIDYPIARDPVKYPNATLLTVRLAVANAGNHLVDRVFISAGWGRLDGVEIVVVPCEGYSIRSSMLPYSQAIAREGILLAPNSVDEVMSVIVVVPDEFAGSLKFRVTAGARNGVSDVAVLHGEPGYLAALHKVSLPSALGFTDYFTRSGSGE